MSIIAMNLALKRAFNLGQTYWQQADSEYTSHHKKADATRAAFEQLVEETCQAIAEAKQPQEAAPRQWVGLTGFEQKELMAMNARDAVFATETKLKEKNT